VTAGLGGLRPWVSRSLLVVMGGLASSLLVGAVAAVVLSIGGMGTEPYAHHLVRAGGRGLLAYGHTLAWIAWVLWCVTTFVVLLPFRIVDIFSASYREARPLRVLLDFTIVVLLFPGTVLGLLRFWEGDWPILAYLIKREVWLALYIVVLGVCVGVVAHRRWKDAGIVVGLVMYMGLTLPMVFDAGMALAHRAWRWDDARVMANVLLCYVHREVPVFLLFLVGGMVLPMLAVAIAVSLFGERSGAPPAAGAGLHRKYWLPWVVLACGPLAFSLLEPAVLGSPVYWQLERRVYIRQNWSPELVLELVNDVLPEDLGVREYIEADISGDRLPEMVVRVDDASESHPSTRNQLVVVDSRLNQDRPWLHVTVFHSNPQPEGLRADDVSDYRSVRFREEWVRLDRAGLDGVPVGCSGLMADTWLEPRYVYMNCWEGEESSTVQLLYRDGLPELVCGSSPDS
jgi:hypothetical protein